MAGALAKYHCNYCDEDIVDVRVKCSVCADFDLCLQCFSCGAAIGPHRSNHSYQLIDCGTFPIFGGPDAWRASDELALLEAVELYGFGNWDDTAAFIGKKSAEEVRDHFVTYFIDGAIGRGAWSSVPNAYEVIDHTCPNNGPMSPSLTTPLAAIAEMSYAEQQHLGYMPNRDDYEREFDNEAESLISTLAVNAADEDDVDIDLKLAHVDMYRRRLSDRFRMKAIARDYGIVTLFYKALTADEEFMSQVTLQPSLIPACSVSMVVDEDTNQSTSSVTSKSSSTPSKKSKVPPSSPAKSEANSIVSTTATTTVAAPEKKDPLAEKFKVFSQFQSALDQKQMFDSMKREKELKARIRELIRYRRNGLKKLNEVAVFDVARNKRDKKKENKKKGSGGNTTCETSKAGSGQAGAASAHLRDSPLLSSTGSGDRTSTATKNRLRDNSTERLTGAESPLSQSGRNHSAMASPAASAREDRLARLERTRTPSGPTASRLAGSEGGRYSPSDRSRRGSGSEELRSTGELSAKNFGHESTKGNSCDFDVNSMPASRLLSLKEKKLCSALRLKPGKYISIKVLLIKESQQSRRSTKGTMLKSPLDTVDKGIKRRVSAFMTRSGWLTSTPAMG